MRSADRCTTLLCTATVELGERPAFFFPADCLPFLADAGADDGVESLKESVNTPGSANTEANPL